MKSFMARERNPLKKGNLQRMRKFWLKARDLGLCLRLHLLFVQFAAAVMSSAAVRCMEAAVRTSREQQMRSPSLPSTQ